MVNFAIETADFDSEIRNWIPGHITFAPPLQNARTVSIWTLGSIMSIYLIL